MPPHSRGGKGKRRDTSPVAQPDNGPPTLHPYLDTLPSPTELIPDQPTPKVFEPTDPVPSTSPTIDNDYEDGDSSSIGEDEEEFASHYSRNSPASTDVSDDAEDDEDDTTTYSTNNFALSPNTRHERLQRVSSVPMNAPQRPPLPTLHSSASLRLPPPPPPPLYPPFYNRPPTPLPPSPSLTSLLRPPSILNRSTTSTRPPSPSSASDVETPGGELSTASQIHHSARRANPLPPTSPKVPTYEYYGFVLYLASTLSFIIYLLWSYLPSPFLHALGITYYPNRWWSLAIPSWIVMGLVWIYVALSSYNVEYMTLSMDRVECMVDDAANVAILDQKGRLRKGGSRAYQREVEERRRIEDARRSSIVKGKRKASGYASGSQGRSTAMNSSGGGGKKQKQKQKQKAEDRERRRKVSASSNNSTRAPSLQRNSAIDQGSETDEYDYLSTLPTSYPADGIDLSYKQIWNQGTDAVMDVPLGGVCLVLYGED
ncbi:uncharacterized protein AB675_3755 [Cyphellophora attinorum]|uniref:PIG-P domain-containing protein n=1 Tax=Cyphellophora attinorum TaxID=1664694 RepID=A0A0N1NXC2_9EURO|nr:uncharacterized protein AB675_3755 [Phialophora attinorum]KPI35223.1 hypothetical protein AB675_3755 [Phialophora attinorum]